MTTAAQVEAQITLFPLRNYRKYNFNHRDARTAQPATGTNIKLDFGACRWLYCMSRRRTTELQEQCMAKQRLTVGTPQNSITFRNWRLWG